MQSQSSQQQKQQRRQKHRQGGGGGVVGPAIIVPPVRGQIFKKIRTAAAAAGGEGGGGAGGGAGGEAGVDGPLPIPTPSPPPPPPSAEVRPAPARYSKAFNDIHRFIAKFKVFSIATGDHVSNDHLLSESYKDARGWEWQLALFPRGLNDQTDGCYSVFLELINFDSLPQGFSRRVALEFAVLPWDSFQYENLVRTDELVRKYDSESVGFGFARAFEHDTIEAQHKTFVDSQGFVRISVTIIDPISAYFRVSTIADLQAGPGRTGGWDSSHWRTCGTAKGFKHSEVLKEIEQLCMLKRIPLVSCRPWLCLPRPGTTGPFRPVLALGSHDLKKKIFHALGDLDEYRIFLEEVNLSPVVGARLQHFQGVMPSEEARQLLLSGTAYPLIPDETFLLFLKVDQGLLPTGRERPVSLSLSTSPPGCPRPKFNVVGRALVARTDQIRHVMQVARTLAGIKNNVPLEVFEQLDKEELGEARQLHRDKTVADAHLGHGSILLFCPVEYHQLEILAAAASPRSGTTPAKPHHAQDPNWTGDSILKRPHEEAEHHQQQQRRRGRQKIAEMSDCSGGEDEEEVAAAPRVTLDFQASVAQLQHLAGFTMEKCLKFARSKARIEIASAIKAIPHDDKDSSEWREVDRFLSICEKEIGGSKGDGGDRG